MCWWHMTRGKEPLSCCVLGGLCTLIASCKETNHENANPYGLSLFWCSNLRGLTPPSFAFEQFNDLNKSCSTLWFASLVMQLLSNWARVTWICPFAWNQSRLTISSKVYPAWKLQCSLCDVEDARSHLESTMIHNCARNFIFRDKSTRIKVR